MNKPGFRCPHCGQAEEMRIDTNRFTMDEVMNVLYVDDTPVPAIAAIAGNPDVTCHKCEEESPANDWLDAFNEPLKYFEMDSLCHCGGELWMDRVENTAQYAFICEKCNWVKPNVKISGL